MCRCQTSVFISRCTPCCPAAVLSFFFHLSRPTFSQLPDRPFHNLKASQSGDWRILWRWRTSSDGFWSSKLCEKAGRVWGFKIRSKTFHNSLDKISRSPDFKALKLWNGQSGLPHSVHAVFTIGSSVSKKKKALRKCENRSFPKKKKLVFSSRSRVMRLFPPVGLISRFYHLSIYINNKCKL